jgi:tetratricopeptide (TPR) repeat protein
VYVQLAAAYLDKARETHDPTYLPKARQAVQKSLDIQPTLDAFQTMTAICNYSHRFEEGIAWGKRGAESAPHDSSIIAALVESHLGLGQVTEAEQLLATLPANLEDFYSSASRGHLLKSRGRADEAAASFLKAGEFAKKGKAPALHVWAQVQASGVWLDSGQAERAVPLLEIAAVLDPTDTELKIHQAELLEATGKTDSALRVYEEILAGSNDAEIHARAFRLAKRLPDAERAKKHFDAAEREYQRAIDAGEVYTLGALARLYLEADVHLDRALELSKRCLEHQRDALTQQTLEAIQRKLQNKPSP